MFDYLFKNKFTFQLLFSKVVQILYMKQMVNQMNYCANHIIREIKILGQIKKLFASFCILNREKAMT